MSLLTFFEWLQYSSLLSAMRGSPWIFPLIASIHLMGLALIGGSVFHLEQTRRGRFARTLGHRSSCGTMDRITVEDRGSNPDRMRFRPSFS